MLNKGQLIEAIRTINPSARLDWLATFEERSLREYLDHLQLTQEPRGRSSIWQRRADAPAAITRRPAA